VTDFGTLFAGIVGDNEEGRFRVAAVAGSPSYMAARSPAGGPALLVRCGSPSPTVPVRLAGIEARYNVRCLLRDEDGEREEHLSIVECLTGGAEEQLFFCGCADQLIGLLGPTPSTESLAVAVDRLVAMFRALSQPARTDVVGLIGELCTIYASGDASRAIRAWRFDPQERFDFVAGTLRLDVKAASGADRVHHLSALQASPAQGTIGVLASVLVSMASGATTVASLVEMISDRLGADHEAVFRLREAIALTMGAGADQAMRASFDLNATLQSLRCFDIASVPALRPPFPDGVSDVRFRTDLDSVEPTPIAHLKRVIDRAGRAILPTRSRSSRA
jgi:hypothetical protein